MQRYSPPKDDQPQLASRGDKRGDRRRADRADRRRQRGYQQDREDSEEEEEVRGWRWRLLLGAARGLGTVLVQLMSEWLHGAAAAAGWGSGCATCPRCPGALHGAEPATTTRAPTTLWYPQERGREPSQENELFALRYSVRQRRQVGAGGGVSCCRVLIMPQPCWASPASSSPWWCGVQTVGILSHW